MSDPGASLGILIQALQLSTRSDASASTISTVEHHYNKQAPPTPVVKSSKGHKEHRNHFQQRKESRTFMLKKFHNQVKRKMVEALSSNTDAVLDLACGRGGDIQKWIDNNVHSVIGIDISENEVKEARRRFAKAQKTFKGRHKNYTFIHNRELGTSPLTTLGRKFPSVSCQFSIHYFFSSKEYITMFLRSVSAHLEDGGHFYGTFPSGEKIVELLRSQASPHQCYKSSLLRVERSWGGGDDDLTAFGCGYTFALMHTVTNANSVQTEIEGACEEFLVFKETFLTLAAEHDLIPDLNFDWDRAFGNMLQPFSTSTSPSTSTSTSTSSSIPTSLSPSTSSPSTLPTPTPTPQTTQSSSSTSTPPPPPSTALPHIPSTSLSTPSTLPPTALTLQISSVAPTTTEPLLIATELNSTTTTPTTTTPTNSNPTTTTATPTATPTTNSTAPPPTTTTTTTIPPKPEVEAMRSFSPVYDKHHPDAEEMTRVSELYAAFVLIKRTHHPTEDQDANHNQRHATSERRQQQPMQTQLTPPPTSTTSTTTTTEATSATNMLTIATTPTITTTVTTPTPTMATTTPTTPQTTTTTPKIACGKCGGHYRSKYVGKNPLCHKCRTPIHNR